ncbi:MAG: Npt1/Npt2 family nucleotide transporter [Rickettsiaceae bacterium]
MPNLKKKQFFSSVKDIIWPIERSELRLFVPMSLMMLCILFNFGALRSIKDSLVVPNIGAEVISFLKLWLVLPSTIIFTLIYAKLSNMFDYEHVFYLIISFFLGFFIFFTYVLYPNQDFYHPNSESIQRLVELYPNFKWFVLIAGKWSYALMYVFCELWSAVIINLLFWQYANNIFDTKSAKRFYPILGMVGNIGLIMAGTVLVSFSNITVLDDEIVPEQCSMVLEPIMITIIISGCIAMMLYRYINQHFVKVNSLGKLLPAHKDDTKTKLSVLDSVKLILKSKYIGHIGLLLLCYGLAINILEGPWKARVRELYPNTVDYINFMGKFNIWMGVSCVVFALIGSNILRKFSWISATLITPAIISITGIIFFVFVIHANDIGFLGGFSPIYLAVVIGAIQNILSKSTKYSLFDSTKEMTYIPLSLELRTKGKAAVEVIGLKFGKSLGAFVQSFIFILLPNASFDSVTIYLMVIFTLIIILWIWDIKKLNQEYNKIKGDKE